MTVQGIHHITLICSDAQRTVDFYTGVLGQRFIKRTVNFDDPGSYHLYFGNETGQPGTLITYFERDPLKAPLVRMGAGQTHHIALGVSDEATQREWREKLVHAGLGVSAVMDRVYFKSIYTRDPDGHIVELATAGPGFMVDEDVQALGQSLKLPSWLEKSRGLIERQLKPLTVPEAEVVISHE